MTELSDRIDGEYPQTREYRLGDVRESLSGDVDELEEDVERLENDDDALSREIEAKRQEMRQRRNQLADIEWLIEVFDADATVTMQSLRMQERDAVEQAVRRGRVGDADGAILRDYTLAASIQDAPWLEDDDDLHTHAELINDLPPDLADWLQECLNEVNDLAPGN